MSPYHGYLAVDFLCESIAGLIFVSLLLGYWGAPYIIWTVILSAGFWVLGVPPVIVYAFVGISLVFIIKPLRKNLISPMVMKVMKGMMPKISETEKTALEAGVVWAEKELFSGKPNFKSLLAEPKVQLTQEEIDFINGPTDELCQIIDDWEVWRTRDLSDKAMAFIKEKGFLGMIISKEYGGLGFSAAGHGEVISKISTKSLTASITIMVPNSLGPAELLSHYGTQAQKDKYLRKLATGEEIPCFGLTEPTAGSDAGSILSEGILFKDKDGKLKIRINWNKRWITLAAISTVIGLAFKLRDPDKLIGDKEDLGITCALIPSNAQGVVIGRRHDPLGVPFYNCPTQGKDVVVDAEDSIIGGLSGAGKGWKMLMESLGAGRGISLPSQSIGGLKLATRVTSAHSLIRQQFGVPIGHFEGVEEPLARIVGANYYLEAMRQYTFSALNQGISPPVVTAMTKYATTEGFRSAINDAMDILGGSGISLGPRNLVVQGYISAPIAITVEGANILTRTLIIFGQGALRAHPYAFREVDAVEKKDLAAFDDAFWGHIGHITRNLCRSLVLSVTRARLASKPVGGPVGRYYQKLSWASASFAIMSDLAMGLLGGKLKFKEKLTGRYADILCWMYIGIATLKRWEDEGRKKEDLPLVHYSMKYCFVQIQNAFDGIFGNFDVPVFGFIFNWPIRLWSRLNKINSNIPDSLTHEMCSLILKDSEQRDRLTSGLYKPKDATDALWRFNETFSAIKKAEPMLKKVSKAIRKKDLPKKPILSVLDEALEKSIITADEHSLIKKSEEMRLDTIQVDDFSAEEYVARS